MKFFKENKEIKFGEQWLRSDSSTAFKYSFHIHFLFTFWIVQSTNHIWKISLTPPWRRYLTIIKYLCKWTTIYLKHSSPWQQITTKPVDWHLHFWIAGIKVRITKLYPSWPNINHNKWIHDLHDIFAVRFELGLHTQKRFTLNVT